MPITDFLQRNASLYREEVALVERNPQLDEADDKSWKEYALVEGGRRSAFRRQITWGEFDDAANQFANLLLASGVQRGDKIALLLMNCIEWLPLYFGILKAGAIVVPLNYRYTAAEIEYCLELADASLLVFGPEFIDRVAENEGKNPKVREKWFVGPVPQCPAFAQSCTQLMAPHSTDAPDIPLLDDEDAAIYFSSGTTGFPKAILHAHQSLMCAAITEQKHHSQSRDDVFLCIPPLYHTGAKMHWFGSLVAGSRAVLLRGVSPRWILQAVVSERVSIVWLLVPWAQDILDALDSGEIDISGCELSRWRLMHIGAQPVPPSLIRRWKKYFPHHQYDTNYGLSESIGPGSVHLGVENIHKVGAIGVPGHGWQARVVNEAGVPVPQGEVGELVLCGPGLMKCYYKDPEATAAVLRDGWLFTGDMAMQDEDGFLFLVDRKKDVIIMGGENIYPVQIEDHLRAMDCVKDVAVIGLPHERLGEIAAAIVELKPGHSCTKEDIDAFCAELPRYKRPREVIFDTVPRNPTGKIEKPRLRQKYGADAIVKKQTEQTPEAPVPMQAAGNA